MGSALVYGGLRGHGVVAVTSLFVCYDSVRLVVDFWGSGLATYTQRRADSWDLKPQARLSAAGKSGGPPNDADNGLAQPAQDLPGVRHRQYL